MNFLDEVREAIVHLRNAAKLTDDSSVAEVLEASTKLAAGGVMLQQHMDTIRRILQFDPTPKPTLGAGVQRRD